MSKNKLLSFRPRHIPIHSDASSFLTFLPIVAAGANVNPSPAPLVAASAPNAIAAIPQAVIPGPVVAASPPTAAVSSSGSNTRKSFVQTSPLCFRPNREDRLMNFALPTK